MLSRRRAAIISLKMSTRGSEGTNIMHFLARTILAGTGVGDLIAPTFAVDLTQSVSGGQDRLPQGTGASSCGQTAARHPLGRGWYPLYKTPSDAITGNTNCVGWKKRPKAGCFRYDKTRSCPSLTR